MSRSPLGPLCCFVFIWISQFFHLVSSWLLSDEITFTHSRAHQLVLVLNKEKTGKKEKQHFCYMSVIRRIYTHITAMYLAASSGWARKNERVELIWCCALCTRWSAPVILHLLDSVHSTIRSTKVTACLQFVLYPTVYPIIIPETHFTSIHHNGTFHNPFSGNTDFWHLKVTFIFLLCLYTKHLKCDGLSSLHWGDITCRNHVFNHH